MLQDVVTAKIVCEKLKKKKKREEIGGFSGCFREKSITDLQTTHDTQLGKLRRQAEYTTEKDCLKNILHFRLIP